VLRACGALILSLSHALTGAAAVILAAAWAIEALWRRRPTREVWALSLGAAVLTAAWFVATRLPHGSGHRALRLAEVLPALQAQARGFEWLALAVLATGVAATWRGSRALGLSVLALAALGFAYRLSGVAAVVGAHRWFVEFNAERLWVLAFLVAAVAVSSLPARWGAVGAAALVASVLARPTATWVSASPLWTDGGEVVSAQALERFAFLREHTPKRSRVFSLHPGYALPAFTGRAIPPQEGNIWAEGSLPQRTFDLALDARRRLLAHSPAAKLSILDHQGASYLSVPPQPGVTPEAWVAQAFPEGTMALIWSDAEAWLFERRR
jgi:hypothetical protein